jgi:hypothetical protein
MKEPPHTLQTTKLNLSAPALMEVQQLLNEMDCTTPDDLTELQLPTQHQHQHLLLSPTEARTLPTIQVPNSVTHQQSHQE